MSHQRAPQLRKPIGSRPQYDPVSQETPLRAPQSGTDSLNPEQTLKNGSDDPSAVAVKDRADRRLSVCRWEIGWTTPALITVPFVLALLIVIAHVCFYKWLNGQPVERVPQAYVTTASTIMANVVGLLLRISLGAASTQYLWRLVRLESHETSTLDDLFSMRGNVLALFRVIAQRKSWLLVTISLFLWSTNIVVSFPPGAVTVVQADNVAEFNVPTFGNFDLTNATYDSIASTTLASALYDYYWGEIPVLLDGSTCAPSEGCSRPDINPSLKRLVQGVILDGKTAALPSPCGPNCFYNIQFTGPYLQCSTTVQNITIRKDRRPAYSSSWTNLPAVSEDSPPEIQNSKSTMANLAFTVLRLNYRNNENGNSSVPLWNVTETKLSCTPSRAEYNIRYAYRDNVQSTDLTIEHPQPLVNLVNGVCWPDPITGQDTKNASCKANRAEQYGYIRDSNLMAVIGSMAVPLTGEAWPGEKITDMNQAPITSGGMTWVDYSYVITDDSSNGTCNIVENTPLRANFYNYTPGRSDYHTQSKSAFIVTQDLLNNMLANITLSTLPGLNIWTTRVNATQQKAVNRYSLSKPLNIAIPYSLLLGLVLPYLVLGLWSLHANGVSAQDGGFFQLLVTTRGSPMLDRAARGGCLGGDENVPERLKTLKVRFGKFINSKEANHGVYLAGFGTDGEVEMLKKGEDYGAMNQ